ncbi:MAG: VanZ family protein [Flavobacteriaceae bacterium]
MQQVFKQARLIIIHPLFIYLCIASLECIPYDTSDNKEKGALHEMPKEGDNFATLADQSIFYFSGKGKYLYPSVECYFSFGNPSFNAEYKDGGLKIIDKTIADQIPLLGVMCDQKKASPKPLENNRTDFLKKMTSVNYLLDHFSEISHFTAYLILACSVWIYFDLKKSIVLRVFFLCFFGGIMLELVQKFLIPGRSGSLEDQILNTLGILTGIGLILFIQRTRFRNYITKLNS